MLTVCLGKAAWGLISGNPGDDICQPEQRVCLSVGWRIFWHSFSRDTTKRHKITKNGVRGCDINIKPVDGQCAQRNRELCKCTKCGTFAENKERATRVTEDINTNKANSSRKTKGDPDIIVIKKYANRRLYNTATSSYVTLDFLSELVKSGHDFVVYDAKSGEDITRPVLTQIIVEQEGKGQNLLPVQFLRQLITFYGDKMQGYVPSYLEMSMDAFARNQEQFREQLDSTLGSTLGANPGYKMIEESVRKNMAMYEQAMKMFSTSVPGMPGMPGMTNPFAAPPAPPHPATAEDAEQSIDDIKQELEALKAKLAQMEQV